MPAVSRLLATAVERRSARTRADRDVQVQPLGTTMPTADYHGATRP
ncbi:hypothetical protein ACH4KO_08815 [Streptomyces anulatus]